MFLIKQTVGFIYIIAILILAFDVLYALFGGIIPGIVKNHIMFMVATLENISANIAMPIDYLVKMLLDYLPGSIREFFPITDTGIFQAQIKWIPILSLFIYTNILKFINDKLLKQKINNIHKNYSQQQTENTNDKL